MDKLLNLLPLAIICAIGGAGYLLARILRSRLAEPRVTDVIASGQSWPLPMPPSQATHGPATPIPAANGPSGFGGWLILMVIGQTLAPFRAIVMLLQDARELEPLLSIPAGRVFAIPTLAAAAGVFGVGLWATILMWRRSRRFPMAFLWQWIAYAVYIVVGLLIAPVVAGVSPATILADPEIGKAAARGVGALVVNGLWVWYLYASRRVRNTFVM